MASECGTSDDVCYKIEFNDEQNEKAREDDLVQAEDEESESLESGSDLLISDSESHESSCTSNSCYSSSDDNYYYGQSDEESWENDYSLSQPVASSPPTLTRAHHKRVRISPKEDSEWVHVGLGTQTENNFKFIPKKEPGINNELITDQSDELDCFFTLFDDTIADKLVQSINDYFALKVKANSPDSPPSAPAGQESAFNNNWKEVTKYEVYKFLAVIAMMGLNPRPAVSDYWSTQSGFHTSWYSKMFQRKRFEIILHFVLHAGDVNAEGKNIIEPFMNSMIDNFSKAFTPFQQISINEMIIGFKGCWSFKQLKQSKRNKYHMKSFGLIDSSTGYVLNIVTYYGSDTSYYQSVDKNSGAAIEIFETLLKNIGHGYHIYADKKYTSKAMLGFLHEEKKYYTGIVQSNRTGFPQELKSLRIAHKESKYWATTDKSLLCVAFKDKKSKRPVIVVSNNTSAETVTVRNKAKPRVVEEYNLFMSGCDRADQLLGYYGFHNRKSRKWWKKLFFWVIEICTVNAFILYKLSRAKSDRKSKSKDISLKSFKLSLVDKLTTLAASIMPDEEKFAATKPSRGRPCIIAKMVGAKHMPMNIKKDRLCKHCRVGRTVYVCAGCEGNPHIHIDCFIDYHSFQK